MTTPPPLICPKCGAHLPAEIGPPGEPRPCPACQQAVEGVVFSSYFRPPVEGRQAESIVSVEDAGCFYHPQSRAVVPCDACGRFLCALCDIELPGRHVCPQCLNLGRQKKSIREFDNSRILYGGIAMLVAVVPVLLMFTWIFTIVTGPLAVAIAIYGLRKPGGLVSSGRVSCILALLLGLAETGVWIVAGLGIFKVI